MKRPDDPRHQKRIELIKSLFAYSFTNNQEFSPKVKKIIESIPTSDKLIQECAPEWPIDQINKVDLSILRLAIYELNHEKTPKKVVIDEAVELAKEVKKHHFSFENVPALPDNILRDVFNALDLDDVALALKGQPKELSDRILENLPQKKQAMYEPKEGPVPRKQVETAQKKVVEFIIQMDADPGNDFSIEEFAEADFIE